MKRCMMSLLLFALAVVPARAHFIWIVPDGTDGTRAKVIFSDSLEPDEGVPVEKVAATKLHVRDNDGRVAAIDWKKGEHAYLVSVPGNGAAVLGGVCQYGVIQRGEGKPFLLAYYPKWIRGEVEAAKPWDKLPLEIVPQGAGRFQVHFAGKPVADAEVVVLTPAADSKETLKTDARGDFRVRSTAPGLYGIRARHVEAKAGEHEGKKYEEARHYATLVFQVAASRPQKALAKGADPAASKLLAEARAARAAWKNFPGFTADVAINLNGKVSRGKVTVSDTGRVSFEQLDNDPEAWAKRVLGSIVAHRIGNNAERDTPCAFADGDEHHPLGRAITVLNDELHSSYRVRDKQIIVVNRQMTTSRFSITVLENRTNAEGKFLPASYVVHHWDTKSGELQKTESHFQTWTTVGAFDLPVTACVITATKDLSTRSLTLSNHKLLEARAR